MKVVIATWRGQELPEGYKAGEQEITPERLFELFHLGFDVALMHSPGEGKRAPERTPLLAVDERGLKFRQR